MSLKLGSKAQQGLVVTTHAGMHNKQSLYLKHVCCLDHVIQQIL